MLCSNGYLSIKTIKEFSVVMLGKMLIKLSMPVFGILIFGNTYKLSIKILAYRQTTIHFKPS